MKWYCISRLFLEPVLVVGRRITVSITITITITTTITITIPITITITMTITISITITITSTSTIPDFKKSLDQKLPKAQALQKPGLSYMLAY